MKDIENIIPNLNDLSEYFETNYPVPTIIRNEMDSKRRMKEVRYCTHWKRRGRARDSAYRICGAHLRGLWLDVGEPMSARSLLRRSWHPLQPLRWRGRGGWGSRPLARFTTCQDDGCISLLYSRTNHSSTFISLQNEHTSY